MIAAFFTVSIAYAVRYGYGMLLPGMLDSLRITKTEAGIISSAYFITYTIFSPVLGLLSDRFGSRLLLTLFPGLLAAGALLMAYVSTVREASLVFALAGLGHAACWAPVVSLVQRWVGDRYRGTALAVTTMGSGVGIAAWSLWLPMIVERSNYREGWMQMGRYFRNLFLGIQPGMRYCHSVGASFIPFTKTRGNHFARDMKRPAVRCGQFGR